MTNYKATSLPVTLLLLPLLFSSARLSAADFSQLVIAFATDKSFSHHLQQSSNTLKLKIKDTSADELEPIYAYDKDLVSRVVIRENANQDVEVELVLTSKSIRSAVYSFAEPFRIVIDLFTANYRESADPLTGLPLQGHSQPATTITQSSEAGQSSHSSRTSTDFAAADEPGSAEIRLAGQPSDAQPAGRRRLLQPAPQEFTNSDEMIVSLENIAAGVGPKWRTYPDYIYRVQTQTLHTGKNYKDWLRKNAGKAMSSADSLANYAAQMFDFGHELKALLIYQKVLYQSPLTFDRDPKHIWNLAEIHFGQGNLILAKGYYESLVDKHPDSPLAQYAKLRILDGSYLAAASAEQFARIPQLIDRLALIDSAGLPEVKAQKAIRQAYWSQNTDFHKTELRSPRTQIPSFEKNTANLLEEASAQTENPKTSFILKTLLLNHRIQNDPWSESLAADTKDYLSAYTGQESSTYRAQLLSGARASIETHLKALAAAGNSSAIIRTIENLPKDLNIVDDSFALASQAAAAYRDLGDSRQALQYYEKVLKLAPDAKVQFYTLANLLDAGSEAILAADSKSQAALVKRLQRQLSRNDKNLDKVWNEFDKADKFATSKNISASLLASIEKGQRLGSYANINLWAYSQSLNPDLAAETPADYKAVFAEGEQTVTSIRNLGKTYRRLGRAEKAKSAINLLRYMSPASFGRKASKDIWAKELADLAETYRRENKYLDAGRIYALTGEKGTDWENRAEALYKGGLLLYRSGRRDEAMNAFEQAASDSNNLLYAELAKKRLEQLKE